MLWLQITFSIIIICIMCIIMLVILPSSSFLKGSRHSSYTSHASRMSYTSHGDLLCGIGNAGKVMTKESQLKFRSFRNGPTMAGSNMHEYSYKSHRGDYVSTCGYFFFTLSSKRVGVIKRNNCA